MKLLIKGWKLAAILLILHEMDIKHSPNTNEGLEQILKAAILLDSNIVAPVIMISYTCSIRDFI